MSTQIYVITHIDFVEYTDKNYNIVKHSTPFEITDGIYVDLETASEELEEIYYNHLEFNADDDDGKGDDSNFIALQYRISRRTLNTDEKCYYEDDIYYVLKPNTTVKVVAINPINKK